jgi:large subunit ribosomal protein L25
VAGERVKLLVRPREGRGSADSRRLRRQGIVPGVLYGRGEPQAICVEERVLRSALTGAGGLHAILDVVVEGKQSTHPSVLKDYQQDVIRGDVTHVDLHEVRLDQPIQATVTVTLVGEAAGSKEGGVLSQVTRELTVEALPLEIPEHLELDISGLGIGDVARVADLHVPDGATVIDDAETVLASVTLPTRVEEPEEMLEEGEAAAVGEGAPGGQQPEAGSEAPAEPGADAAGEQQSVEG